MLHIPHIVNRKVTKWTWSIPRKYYEAFVCSQLDVGKYARDATKFLSASTNLNYN